MKANMRPTDKPPPELFPLDGQTPGFWKNWLDIFDQDLAAFRPLYFSPTRDQMGNAD